MKSSFVGWLAGWLADVPPGCYYNGNHGCSLAMAARARARPARLERMGDRSRPAREITPIYALVQPRGKWRRFRLRLTVLVYTLRSPSFFLSSSLAHQFFPFFFVSPSPSICLLGIASFFGNLPKASFIRLPSFEVSTIRNGRYGVTRVEYARTPRPIPAVVVARAHQEKRELSCG